MANSVPEHSAGVGSLASDFLGTEVAMQPTEIYDLLRLALWAVLTMIFVLLVITLTVLFIIAPEVAGLLIAWSNQHLS